MERVAFHIEGPDPTTVEAWINPESLTVKRIAGLRERSNLLGLLNSGQSTDSPLLLTGGGRTQIDFELLFDSGLAGQELSLDVRDHTSKLSSLAENNLEEQVLAKDRMTKVRFIWGDTWNILGVIAAVSERLDYFDERGVPRRSWMKLRFIRVAEDTEVGVRERNDIPSSVEAIESMSIDEASMLSHAIPDPGEPFDIIDEIIESWEEEDEMELDLDEGSGEEIADVFGMGQEIDTGKKIDASSSDATVAGQRLEHLAHRYYGDPAKWRTLAIINNVDDPLRLRRASVLKVPLRFSK